MTFLVAESRVGFKGELTIELVYPDKRLVHFKESKNLIVLGGKQLALAPIYLTGRVSDPIATLHAGNGGTIDPEGLFPKQVDHNRTALFSEIISTPTTYSANTSVPNVTFLADITESQCNGSLINEAGLFTAAGTMFNIKTFSGIPKTSAFSIHFEWKITVI